MRSPETAADIDDLEAEEDASEVEEIILAVGQECSEAVKTTENSNALNEIFEMARATYEKDPAGWDQLFENLQSEVNTSSDDEEAADILDQYKRKAAALG